MKKILLFIAALCLLCGVDDEMTIGYFPPRPKDATALKIAGGRVVNYIASAKSPIAEHLVIQTAEGRYLTFELDLKTRVDGVPFFCGNFVACMLPPSQIHVGKTNVAVLYWDTDQSLIGATAENVPGSGLHGTDDIITL